MGRKKDCINKCMREKKTQVNYRVFVARRMQTHVLLFSFARTEGIRSDWNVWLEMKDETVRVCCCCAACTALTLGHNNLAKICDLYSYHSSCAPSPSTKSQLHARAIFQFTFRFSASFGPRIDAQSVSLFRSVFCCAQRGAPDYDCLVDLFNRMHCFICIYLELWSQIICHTLNLSSYYIIHTVCVCVWLDVLVVCAISGFFMANKAYNKTDGNSFRPRRERHRPAAECENEKFFRLSRAASTQPDKSDKQSATAKKSHVLIAQWVLVHRPPAAILLTALVKTLQFFVALPSFPHFCAEPFFSLSRRHFSNSFSVGRRWWWCCLLCSTATDVHFGARFFFHSHSVVRAECFFSIRNSRLLKHFFHSDALSILWKLFKF